jgi:hypothetical protein
LNWAFRAHGTWNWPQGTSWPSRHARHAVQSSVRVPRTVGKGRGGTHLSAIRALQSGRLVPPCRAPTTSAFGTIPAGPWSRKARGRHPARALCGCRLRSSASLRCHCLSTSSRLARV